MPQIIIREQEKTDTGFSATVSFDGRGEYNISISEPFTPKQEKDLEWYFEEWLVYPMLESKKVEQVEASIFSYGEELFEQVFGNRKIYSEYEQLKDRLSQLEIIIDSKTPEFQGFHWESMRDPDLPRPLAVDCVMVRRKSDPSLAKASVESSPVINLLVVVARPDEEQDVGYRTISRPLVELIDNSQLPVRVDILRPGTYEALSRHLEAKGEGFYHIIHLDLHGALLTYEQIKNPPKSERYFYQGRFGRGDIEPFSGLKAFLAFEEEEKGKVDLVEAQELTDLLTGKGIPVCILNACQSGKQVRSPLTPLDKDAQSSLNQIDKENQSPLTPLTKGGKEEKGEENQAVSEDFRETSLGSRLMQTGMQMVVAMGYSVTVSAAKLMMEQLYQHLFAGEEITKAIRLGRRELYNNKERKAYFNQVIELEDWLLPVVYSNQQVDFQLREFTPEEEENYWQEVGTQYRFVQPSYGFIGRDLDILKLEKALLNHNILLLRGMGGTGKTTLLNYLREWWQRTNFVEDVFYFGYDEKAWTLEQILFFIGQQIYGKFEAAKFQVMNPNAQVQKLARKLKSEPYALMLDNLESVTGKELAIQNTLPEGERNEIRDFLSLLVGGKTKVVLGSRTGEEWLQEKTFRENTYQLQGLDREARTELAEKILQRNLPSKEIPKIREDEHFQKLMKLLAGYPLAMEVVLANLKQQKPEKILQGLEAADIDVDTESEKKTESIFKCIEYSYGNLSPEAQKLLLCLAPFSGFIHQGGIAHYGEELQKLEPFSDYDFSQFDQAIEEAINWGLLSPIDPNLPEFLSIQPVFPYFLKTKLKEVDERSPLAPTPLPSASPLLKGRKGGNSQTISEALREGFKNHYLWLAYSYGQLMNSNDANERQWGIIYCRWEYENLYKALRFCTVSAIAQIVKNY